MRNEANSQRRLHASGIRIADKQAAEEWVSRNRLKTLVRFFIGAAPYHRGVHRDKHFT
jgi:hypothetical protein